MRRQRRFATATRKAYFLFFGEGAKAEKNSKPLKQMKKNAKKKKETKTDIQTDRQIGTVERTRKGVTIASLNKGLSAVVPQRAPVSCAKTRRTTVEIRLNRHEAGHQWEKFLSLVDEFWASSYHFTSPQVHQQMTAWSLELTSAPQ